MRTSELLGQLQQQEPRELLRRATPPLLPSSFTMLGNPGMQSSYVVTFLFLFICTVFDWNFCCSAHPPLVRRDLELGELSEPVEPKMLLRVPAPRTHRLWQRAVTGSQPRTQPRQRRPQLLRRRVMQLLVILLPRLAQQAVHHLPPPWMVATTTSVGTDDNTVEEPRSSWYTPISGCRGLSPSPRRWARPFCVEPGARCAPSREGGYQ
jgi:hypothetical protein